MQGNGFIASGMNSVNADINNMSNNNMSSTGASSPSQGGMPSISMDSQPPQRQVVSSEINSTNTGYTQKVLVEIRLPKNQGLMGASETVSQMNIGSFQLDTSYQPVSINPDEQIAGIMVENEETVIIRGVVEEDKISELEAQPNVVKVYKDTQIAPFNPATLEKVPEKVEQDTAVPTTDDKKSNCPIGTCDCSPATAKGTIADVAKYLGVDKIWEAGYKGQGIVVGVVDGGITAEGRPVNPGETIRRVPNVIGGHLPDWGTRARSWGEHGNMSATDVLGMAPEAKLYDLCLAGGDAISNAIAAFDWAIKQHRTDGTPHVLTNSWGIFQKNWDEFYATNPQHPFTRKVVEAINEGILVLFAAGNCGGSCPSSRCGEDSGPGKSIWGANGHPLVMTVGAVNKDEQFVGYSSQGPAALDPNKPDFCSITHFKGYFGSDNGTSAACPIAAGVVALLKQAKKDLGQEEAKQALKKTAKDIGAPGFDQHSGAGILQAKAAFDSLLPQQPKWSEWVSIGGNSFSSPAAASWGENRIDIFALGADSEVYQKSGQKSKQEPDQKSDQNSDQKCEDHITWGEWTSLGGFALSAPAAVSWGEDRIDVFIIGQKRQLLRKFWDGTCWSEWEDLGGLFKQGVTVCSWGVNRLDVFAVGADNAMYHKYWDGTCWSEWISLGGLCLSSPAAVSSEPNRIDVFVRADDHAIYRKTWDGTAWSSNWESLGGLWIYSPAAVTWSEKRLDVFAIGTNNAMHRKYWDGLNWSAWESLGGTSISSPAVVARGKNTLETFVVGGDNAIYRKYYL
ncbi:MAG: S8 family serine peptidase [Scytonematopsis contorta HA4267-MV1]|jgi:subtilisin family serine protease|nr:S8 family serine peptidase [Scytonematopsis contorta HA4267-MV1]